MRVRLNKSSFRALSNISAGIAQVFFGAVIAGFAVLSLDPIKLFVLVLELSLAFVFWFLSVYFAEKGKL